jgi:1-acyl-sn-glycerol-3-phosphate acyltransferase
MLMKLLHRLWLGCVLVLSMAYWAVGGFLFVLAGLVLAPLLPLQRSRAIGQWLLQEAFHDFLRLLRLCGVFEYEFRGFEALEGVSGGLIIAPNHPALWDAVFVIAKIRGLRCILKASLMHNPFLRGGAKLAGFIPNKPAHKMLQHSIEALRQGDRLLFFPEGTRTRKQENAVNRFPGRNRHHRHAVERAGVAGLHRDQQRLPVQRLAAVAAARSKNQAAHHPGRAAGQPAGRKRGGFHRATAGRVPGTRSATGENSRVSGYGVSYYQG